MNRKSYFQSLADDEDFQRAKKYQAFNFALGKAVVRGRIQKGLTQTELACRVKTGQPNISRIEDGHGNPTLDVITRLCTVLDIQLTFQNRAEVANCTQFEISVNEKTATNRIVIGIPVPNWPLRDSSKSPDNTASKVMETLS